MSEGTVPAKADREALTAFFFWSAWATATDRPASRRLLHQQLAARAAGGQHPTTTSAAMWSMASASSCCWPASPPCCGCTAPARHEEEAGPAQERPAAGRGRHAFDEGHAQVLLRRDRPDAAADRHGRDHRALRGRGPVLLRPPAGRDPALRGQPHLAHPGRHLLDRHRLAGHRPLHRAAAGRQGTQVPEARASTSCSTPCWSSWWARPPPAGSARLQRSGTDFSFWLGNQGLEFTSMGRVWQILLFVGLLLWACCWAAPCGPR